MDQNGFSFRQYWKEHHLAILAVVFAAIGALYAFLPYHFPLKPAASEKTAKPENKEETNKTVNVSNNQNVTPSPKDTANKIIAEIEAVPPLQREDMAKAYVGIPVDWDMYFVYGTPDDKNKFRLMFSPTTRRTGIYVKCSVSKESNAHLLRITENTKLHVHGTIASIESGSIYLKDAKVSQIATQ